MPAYGRQESETDESRLSLVVSRDDNVSAFRTAPSARNPATRMGIREVSQSLPVRFRRLLVFMKIALMTEGTYPFAFGGVSVWCDQLIRGMPGYQFHVVGRFAGNDLLVPGQRL